MEEYSSFNLLSIHKKYVHIYTTYSSLRNRFSELSSVKFTNRWTNTSESFPSNASMFYFQRKRSCMSIFCCMYNVQQCISGYSFVSMYSHVIPKNCVSSLVILRESNICLISWPRLKTANFP